MTGPFVVQHPNQCPDLLANGLTPTLWTAVIPAAGRGSRLGWQGPKILYSIAGRTILSRIHDLLAPFCARMVFVVSPAAEQPVMSALGAIAESGWSTVIQSEPMGMAHAVECGLAEVASPYTLVLWGDQAAVHAHSVETAVRLVQGPLLPDALVPTILRATPYVHFERDLNGRIGRVLQAREGDVMPERGESDSGLFLFRTEVLRRRMVAYLRMPSAIGARSGELNFLPIIPMMAAAGDSVLTAHIIRSEESIGVNTPEEGAFLSEYLSRRESGASA
jgi:bifunctional UDP-N-acetylglucosamine pyrophosphorylase / glucosamine-1-phosphate N-acetyltransferase